MPNNSAINILPKIELHLHLEGTAAAQTVRRLYERSGRVAPEWTNTPEAPGFTDFGAFVRRYYSVCEAITKESDFEDFVQDVIDYVKTENLLHCELSWTPFYYLQKGMNFFKIMERMARKIEDAGLSDAIFFIIDTQRDHGREVAKQVFEKVFQVLDLNVCGIGLTGEELSVPSADFEYYFKKAAQEFGLGCTAHAGEFGPPAEVRSCVETLGVSRIGHGIRAVEDEALMDFLFSKNIHLEICPTSNVKLFRVKNYEQHPVGVFKKRGLSFSINSDDPAIFGSSISGEYEMVEKHLHFSKGDFQKVLLDAAAAGFVSAERRAALKARILQEFGV